MLDIPQVLLPFRIDPNTNDIICCEQDSDADIEQCIEAICSYVKGEREERPDFGISDQAFQERGVDLNRFRQEIKEFEPRADLLFETDADWIELAETIDIKLNLSEGGVG